MKWTLTTDPLPPKCGAPRSRRSETLCELPPDHITGRATGSPRLEIYHLGRSRSGRWYSWPSWTAQTPPGES